ncbi:Annexin [Thalictrum thalictroides]|uniref:Annexin n=1 Tax=Thalictrum thalictroides TaxID=46969 RepID=A0A7J6WF76_THATH|nr:Annexin [Thalictrum thalictroides]
MKRVKHSSDELNPPCIRKKPAGFGTHEKALISVIGHRNTAQRQLIKQAYQELYNEDLTKRLESELTGDFEKVVYWWMHDPIDRDAILAHAVLKNLSQNYKVIIEITCAQSLNELFAVKRAYQNLYKYSLEEDVASYSSGGSGDLRKASSSILMFIFIRLLCLLVISVLMATGDQYFCTSDSCCSSKHT